MPFFQYTINFNYIQKFYKKINIKHITYKLEILSQIRVILFARVFIAIVFFLSGFLKIGDSETAAINTSILLGLDLPFSKQIINCVIIIEIVLSLFILIQNGQKRVFAYIFAGLLSCFFVLFSLVRVSQGTSIPCGCFGSFGWVELTNLQHLFLNIFLFLCVILCLAKDKTEILVSSKNILTVFGFLIVSITIIRGNFSNDYYDFKLTEKELRAIKDWHINEIVARDDRSKQYSIDVLFRHSDCLSCLFMVDKLESQVQKYLKNNNYTFNYYAIRSNRNDIESFLHAIKQIGMQKNIGIAMLNPSIKDVPIKKSPLIMLRNNKTGALVAWSIPRSSDNQAKVTIDIISHIKP